MTVRNDLGSKKEISIFSNDYFKVQCKNSLTLVYSACLDVKMTLSIDMKLGVSLACKLGGMLEYERAGLSCSVSAGKASIVNTDVQLSDQDTALYNATLDTLQQQLEVCDTELEAVANSIDQSERLEAIRATDTNMTSTLTAMAETQETIARHSNSLATTVTSINQLVSHVAQSNSITAATRSSLCQQRQATASLLREISQASSQLAQNMVRLSSNTVIS